MELGEKLRHARIEAGLSQRQLCEGIVTRNMLSQIENGAAKPSVKTLSRLAERLGKNISYFLEDTAVLSPNLQLMEHARAEFDAGNYAQALQILEDYRQPDPVFHREYLLLWSLCCMEYARQQLELGKTIYARELLEKAKVSSAYCGDALERQRLLLLGRLPGEQVADRLPSLDEELLLRAGEAKNRERMEALLDAVEDQSADRWRFLRGKVCFDRKQYKQARKHFQAVEKKYPQETAPLLEICCRELGDFKQAYFYACKQK